MKIEREVSGGFVKDVKTIFDIIELPEEDMSSYETNHLETDYFIIGISYNKLNGRRKVFKKVLVNLPAPFKEKEISPVFRSMSTEDLINTFVQYTLVNAEKENINEGIEEHFYRVLANRYYGVRGICVVMTETIEDRESTVQYDKVIIYRRSGS